MWRPCLETILGKFEYCLRFAFLICNREEKILKLLAGEKLIWCYNCNSDYLKDELVMVKWEVSKIRLACPDCKQVSGLREKETGHYFVHFV